LNIDYLIVAGWQRLIPKWLIEHCNKRVIGIHGSPYGIEQGRGRSPQNWALLMGKNKFSISIFQIDEGIDSGDIIDARTFSLSPFDNIRSSYIKAAWLSAHMIIDAIKNKKIENDQGICQKHNNRYLPQRLPEDGQIDWTLSSNNIYNLIRALTKPYPGAYTKISGNKCIIWNAIPFDKLEGFDSFIPGQIIKISNGFQEILIKTGDAALLITEYDTMPREFKSDFCEGLQFDCFSFSDNIKNIVQRHYEKYPHYKIQEDLIDFLDSWYDSCNNKKQR